jgi:predicted metal-binding membrane protein
MEVSTNSAVTREIAEQAVAASHDRTEQWARATASGVFLLAAAYTFYAARGMSGGMWMPGGWTMPMMWMAMPGQSMAGAGFVFLLMWQAMMIAMMLPSSWPTLELYSRVARNTGQRWPMFNTVLAAARSARLPSPPVLKFHARRCFPHSLANGFPPRLVCHSCLPVSGNSLR